LFLTSAVGGQLDVLEKNPVTDLIGGMMGPGAGLDVLEKREISCRCWDWNHGPSSSSLVAVPAAIPCWQLYLYLLSTTLRRVKK
jgi:hypothetical protein